MANEQDTVTKEALHAKSAAAMAQDEQQHPRLFYGLLLGVFVLIAVAILIYFNQSPTVASPQASTTSTPQPPDTSYGEDPNPPVIVTDRKVTRSAPTMTPAPGVTAPPINSGTQTSQSSSFTQQPVPASIVPSGPRLTVVYQQNQGNGSAPSGAGDFSANAIPGDGGMNGMYAQLATLRNSILADEASHGIGAASAGTAIASAMAGAPQPTLQTAQVQPDPAAPQQAGPSDYGSTPSDNGGDPGRMNTRFYAPTSACTIPMGTYIPVLLVPALDSSLAGNIVAIVQGDQSDPRSGATCIPNSTKIIGEFTGLTPGAGHLGATWTWLTQPDLCRRQLQQVSTTDMEGATGLAGRVNTHLWSQFRDSLFQSIVSGAGQIIASAVSHGGTGTVVYGGTPVTTTVPGQANLPTLYVGQATPFDLLLSTDYTVVRPYMGDGKCF